MPIPVMRRRRFLLNAGLLAVAAPFVHRLDARGATTSRARLLLVFHGNGHRRGQWASRNTDEDFELHRIAAPLTPFRDQMILFDRLHHEVMQACSFSTTKHGLGSGIAFTGRPVVGSGWPSGESVDQFVAGRLGDQTPLRSLQLGAGIHDTNVYGRISFGAGGVALTPEQVPATAYANLFAPLLGGEGGAAAEEAQRRLARRLSVLDLVGEDVCALRQELGARDRERLEAHCEGIREIERGLSGSVDGAYCEPLSDLVAEDGSNANYERSLRDHIALTRLAFACDLTRVATLQLGQAHGGRVPEQLGISGGHHHLSHYASNGEPGGDEPYIAISEWYSAMVAHLLGELQAVPDEDGTLLDNTVIAWGSDISDGEEHGEHNVPWAVFGGSNLGVRGGRMLDAGDRNVNDLLVSLCNVMGLDDVESFGEPGYCSGPIPLG
ncbi:MAG: DUF1552 domain-containing protein [Myxococcota bacterium]